MVRSSVLAGIDRAHHTVIRNDRIVDNVRATGDGIAIVDRTRIAVTAIDRCAATAHACLTSLARQAQGRGTCRSIRQRRVNAHAIDDCIGGAWILVVTHGRVAFSHSAIVLTGLVLHGAWIGLARIVCAYPCAVVVISGIARANSEWTIRHALCFVWLDARIR